MAIVRWSPIRELEEMRRNLDRLFGEFAEPAARPQFLSSRGEPGTAVPSMDVFDRKEELVIRVDLAGVEKDRIDLLITKDSMTIKADVKKEEDIRQEDYYIQERNSAAYSRMIQLPKDADSSKARASYKNGVLEIVVPREEEAKATEIKVDIS